MAALRGILPSARFCSVKSHPHHPLPSQADPTRFPQLPLDRGAFAPRPRNPTTPLPMVPRPEHLPTSIHQQPFRGHLLDTSSRAPGQPAPRATPPSRRRPHSAIAPRRPAIGFHWKLEGNHPSQPACRTAGTFATTPRVQGLHNTDRTQQATRRHGGSAGSRPRRIEIQYSPNMHWTSSAPRDRGTTGCVSCHCLATGTGGRYLPGRLSCFNIWVVLSTGGSMSRQNLGFGLMYIGMYCHLDAELDAGPRGRHVISPRNQTDADAGCKVPSQAPPSPRRWETVPPLHSPLGTSMTTTKKVTRRQRFRGG